MSKDQTEPEAILITEDTLKELGISPQELQEAMSTGGEIHSIPRKINLRFEDIAKMMKGKQVTRGDVTISLKYSYNPDD